MPGRETTPEQREQPSSKEGVDALLALKTGPAAGRGKTPMGPPAPRQVPVTRSQRKDAGRGTALGATGGVSKPATHASTIAQQAAMHGKRALSDLGKLTLASTGTTSTSASPLPSPAAGPTLSTITGRSMEEVEAQNRELQMQLQATLASKERLESAMQRLGNAAEVERQRMYAEQLEKLWEECRATWDMKRADQFAAGGIRGIADSIAREYLRLQNACGTHGAGAYAWRHNIGVGFSLE